MNRRVLCVLLLACAPDAEAACRQVKAESSVLGVRLAHEASARRVLGRWDELPSEQDKTAEGTDADFPFVRVRSADGRQEAKLFVHYGAVAGTYQEIEVRPADPGKGAAKRLPADELATERGVRLGLREADLLHVLGPCFRREREGSEALIVYAIEDPGHALPRRTGMPSYFARYAFARGRLVRFRLGFESP